jgi:chaperonin cofactor prefoldin
MPRNRSAIAALQKLEADREALDAKQRELEVQAARKLGEIILGSGLESFSKKVAEELGKLGENAAIEKLTGRGATRASNAAPQTQ